MNRHGQRHNRKRVKRHEKGLYMQPIQGERRRRAGQKHRLCAAADTAGVSLAPITPHLYMTQCMDDKKPEERARGMAAGLALLKGCDFVIAGVKYGITEGMDREIHTANMLGIAVIDANQIKRHLEYEEKRQERAASDYAKLHSCEFCKGSKLYSCTGYDCREPYRRAYEYALSRIRERQET